MGQRAAFLASLLCVVLNLPAAAGPAGNMIGRQSQNEGMVVVPAPGKVTIDGKLDDWDWSGRIWCFADRTVRSRYSVEVAAMWTPDALCLAAKWRDPTPAFSAIDPDFNPGDGWKSDAWQMRVKTDRTLWITTWLFTARKLPVMHIAYWKNEGNSRDGQDELLLKAKPGGTDLSQGAAMAYQMDADGKGYVQEVRIPWKLIYRQPPKLAAGLTFRLGNEFLWGDPTGKTWPIHRYADNMQPGHTSREFYWTAVRAWGDAKLMAKGGVPARQYTSEAAKLPGTVPIRAAIPRDAARFTLAINDAQGRRVRNLAADFAPDDYTVKLEGDTRAVEVMWDCLDDWNKLVTPGTYRVVGLTQHGLGAEYEMCFYNPGTPPWATRDGSGAWGADHAAPLRVARAGKMMIVSWPFAEGGSGIVGIGPDGLKKWGEKRGATLLAADENYVYAIPAGWHIKKEVLIRLRVKDGSYAPFVLDGKERPFELPIADIFDGKPPGKVVAMAASGGKLALAMSEGKIAILDATSATVPQSGPADGVGPVAYAVDGTLYALLKGKLHAISLRKLNVSLGGAARKVDAVLKRAIPTPGLGEAAAIGVDLDGNILLADTGPDSQVKAYTPTGKLAYTCGKKGGRPIRGAFEPQAMSHVSSVAVDAKGQVWTVENWHYPRRVSVWGRDGKLVRDYIGNTGYAGSGTYLHNQDPTLGYVGPMEVKLDKANGTWRVTQVMWVPDQEKGESFPISDSTAALPQRFVSDASGKPREYLFFHPYDAQAGNVVFMQRGKGWQPVAAVCYAAHISGRITHHSIAEEQPSGELAGLDAYDGVFWNDQNGDGRVQRAECTVVPAKRKTDPKRQRGEGPFPLISGWGGRIGSDLVFYTNGLTRFRPLRFTADGAPVYGPAGMSKLAIDDRGDLVPVPEENLLLCLSFKGYGDRTTGMLGIDPKAEKVLWSYPNLYPGVHGSHNATMPTPGLLIGPLKVLGVAHVNDSVGRVFALRGNLGQDFFFTTDGLMVGAMFQDGRLPGESLPPKESQLKGMPMEGFSNGGEPFNGWFGKQADGKLRMTTGFAREACMILEVKGLESIRRFKGSPVSLDSAAVIRADRDNAARAQAAAKPKAHAVARLAKAPAIDGQDREWRAVKPIELKSGGHRLAAIRLAWDPTHLYAFFNVQDPSPWRNQGKDYRRLFKTGDAVDIHLTTAGGKPTRRDPAAGDLRVVLSQLAGKPVAVLMKPIDKTAPADAKVAYTSPVGTKAFDRVARLADAKVSGRTGDRWYTVEAAIPWSALGVVPEAGMTLRGDVGVISSDADGRTNTARTYWANPATNLVNDEPLEAWLYPHTWGQWTLE
ncbi:hypothetical protein HQ576_06730 [bacterium]|nr:hypothetical protein [bacterium]